MVVFGDGMEVWALQCGWPSFPGLFRLLGLLASDFSIYVGLLIIVLYYE